MAETTEVEVGPSWVKVADSNCILQHHQTPTSFHVFVGTGTPTANSPYIFLDHLQEEARFDLSSPVWMKAVSDKTRKVVVIA